MPSDLRQTPVYTSAVQLLPTLYEGGRKMHCSHVGNEVVHWSMYHCGTALGFDATELQFRLLNRP